jgi:NADPH:quinone reductase-like Zn-dependent oxidoreductase
MKLKSVFKWAAVAVALAVSTAALYAYWSSTNSCTDRDTPPSSPRDPMKAVVHCDYGGPETLRLADVEKPVPGDSQMLVRVRAAALNPLDWHYMRGEPFIGRLGMGLRKPKDIRLGVDYAGTVVAVGKSVTQFKPGDEVFGGRSGALAEYITVRADRAVVLKPANLTLEQAAAVPVAAITALQGLRDKGKLRPGQRVLINGASGGVGTFAVQIAKALGANVTGVSSSRNVELVRSIGADRVIDYTRENFTESAERYDLIVDNVGNHPLSDLERVLEPNGTYVMIGGPSGRWIAPFPRVLRLMVASRFGSHDMRFFLAELNKEDLTFLRDLMADGKVVPVVDRTYPLSQVREAIAYLETGRARGKVVLTVD